jgi:hypothetical protein
MPNKPSDVRVSPDLLERIRQRLISLNQIADFGPELFELLNRSSKPADQQGEPVAWVECSPAWLKSGGDCATAPRICVGRHGISHLHPAHAQPSTAKVDDQTEFEAWFLANVEPDEGLTLERSAARPDQYELDETAQIYRGWQARSKLNTPQ